MSNPIEPAVKRIIEEAAPDVPVYWLTAPDDEPGLYVAYSVQAEIDLEPDLKGRGTLFQHRSQVDVYGTNPLAVQATGKALRDGLCKVTGIYEGIEIALIRFESGFDTTEGGDGAIPTVYYRRSTDFIITTRRERDQ